MYSELAFPLKTNLPCSAVRPGLATIIRVLIEAIKCAALSNKWSPPRLYLLGLYGPVKNAWHCVNRRPVHYSYPPANNSVPALVAKVKRGALIIYERFAVFQREQTLAPANVDYNPSLNVNLQADIETYQSVYIVHIQYTVHCTCTLWVSKPWLLISVLCV